MADLITAAAGDTVVQAIAGLAAAAFLVLAFVGTRDLVAAHRTRLAAGRRWVVKRAGTSRLPAFTSRPSRKPRAAARSRAHKHRNPLGGTR